MLVFYPWFKYKESNNRIFFKLILNYKSKSHASDIPLDRIGITFFLWNRMFLIISGSKRPNFTLYSRNRNCNMNFQFVNQLKWLLFSREQAYKTTRVLEKRISVELHICYEIYRVNHKAECWVTLSSKIKSVKYAKIGNFKGVFYKKLLEKDNYKIFRIRWHRSHGRGVVEVEIIFGMQWMIHYSVCIHL